MKNIFDYMYETKNKGNVLLKVGCKGNVADCFICDEKLKRHIFIKIHILCCHIYHSLSLLYRNHLKASIGVEELGHLEMIGTLVYQLTRNLSNEDVRKGGFDAYFVDHTTGVYPSSAAGVPFTAAYLQSKGDIITDLH